MSKRGKDLFYLLGQREQDVRSSDTAVATRRAPAASNGTWARKVRRWLGARAPDGRLAARGKSEGKGEGQVPFGLILAAVALLSLGAGFGLGRFLPRAAAPELVVRPEANAPRKPGPVEPTPPAPGELAADKEEENLSKLWFQLLQFDAPRRAEAAQAATFLRANGVDTARIRKFQTKPSKRDVWVVLAYAPAREAAAEVLAKLQDVPASRTWLNLTSTIAKMTVKDLWHPE